MLMIFFFIFTWLNDGFNFFHFPFNSCKHVVRGNKRMLWIGNSIFLRYLGACLKHKHQRSVFASASTPVAAFSRGVKGARLVPQDLAGPQNLFEGHRSAKHTTNLH
ncbi:hypothetical protein AVEN_157414-1 [Araneus ventricosus]|uniref:Secreted protein n=1 Tax=Araneus ventricosus TaxID=182803 RepID=A0A4Y2M7N5_ARAVE|nr:hypothetical protein AVEN_157414-1 [Araneus ventricosus]